MCASSTRSPRSLHANVTTVAVPSDQEILSDHQRGTPMYLKCQSCRGIPSNDHPVGRGLLVGILVLLMAVSSTLAWNKAGHMVSGAIAYADLKQNNPQTLTRVIALLKSHPHFATKWAPRFAQLHLSPEE